MRIPRARRLAPETVRENTRPWSGWTWRDLVPTVVGGIAAALTWWLAPVAWQWLWITFAVFAAGTLWVNVVHHRQRG